MHAKDFTEKEHSSKKKAIFTIIFCVNSKLNCYCYTTPPMEHAGFFFYCMYSVDSAPEENERICCPFQPFYSLLCVYMKNDGIITSNPTKTSLFFYCTCIKGWKQNIQKCDWHLGNKERIFQQACQSLRTNFSAW